LVKLSAAFLVPVPFPHFFFKQRISQVKSPVRQDLLVEIEICCTRTLKLIPAYRSRTRIFLPHNMFMYKIII